MSKVETINSVEALEDALSEPPVYVIDAMARLQGDIIVLGVGGKMGPTLARMAKRASDDAGVKRRVIGVARFSSKNLPARLNMWGVETITADLLNADQLVSLPDAANVIYMAGMKFGSTGNEGLTWAMNVLLPGLVAQRYRGSAIAAFSTGNVYGLVPVVSGGSIESDPPNPAGEYATSCLGRDRIFEHFAKTTPTPVSIIRLNYATELRYGVLVDLARKVWDGREIDLSMGVFNAIWQTDANAMSLASLLHAGRPAFVLNVAGPEMLSVRRVCTQLGQLLGKTPKFFGTEQQDALLNNGQLGHGLFGYPRTSADTMLRRVADWVKHVGEYLDKPTHFEARDGKY
jgi:dTDP-4-dehydrorhamnose reductase